MKASIEVESRKEADLIKAALDEPLTRAYVQIIGALSPLTPRQREHVMASVQVQSEEPAKEEK